MVAQILSTIVHPLLCYVFVVVLEYDIIGIAIAMCLTRLLLLVSVTCIAHSIETI